MLTSFKASVGQSPADRPTGFMQSSCPVVSTGFGMDSAEDRIVEHLRQAEKHRKLANITSDTRLKRSLLALADDYETLAAVAARKLPL